MYFFALNVSPVNVMFNNNNNNNKKKKRNQVPPSHFRCRFTRIYVTVEKKRQSQLPFHADFKEADRLAKPTVC